MRKTPKYTELTLQQKVELINFIELGHTEREAATHFNISKGSVSNIKKKKEEYIQFYEDYDFSKDRIRKLKKTENEEINNMTWSWFQKARSINLPITGPLLQEAALQFAKKLGKNEFTASAGWLDNFKKRYQIVFKTLNGESASSDVEGVQGFLKDLSENCLGYNPDQIYNADETALYFRGLSQKSLIEKYKECKGSKFCKEKITVLLATNMTGDKLTPLIIGKSKSPRCFKNIDTQKLPVIYKNNSKAWMNTSIFEEWLKSINEVFIKQNKKIILFLDNFRAHCKIDLSNIKLQFLPANTTAIVQPLDQGVV